MVVLVEKNVPARCLGVCFGCPRSAVSLFPFLVRVLQACSEFGDGGGVRSTRRAHSVVPSGRRSLSTAVSSLSISSSDLSGGGRSARAAPTLCLHHRPPSVCRRPSCEALHICRLYVDGFCPHGDAACRWGHAVASEINEAALSAHQLRALAESELLWMVRALVRQTAPVAAEEYRSQLAVCPDYAADARCRRADCFRLHLCPRLATGECGAGDSCRWSHRLTDPDNVMVLLRLRCSELSEAEVLARLVRRVPGGIGFSHGSDQQDSSGDRINGASAGFVAIASASATSTARVHLEGTRASAPSQLALDVDLCQNNIHPARCAGSCGNLHLCRLFVADMCPFGRTCRSGHRLLSSQHNAKVLKERGLDGLSQEELLSAIKAGYLKRNRITDLERRLAVQICHAYLDGDCDDEYCSRLHICEDYIDGVCANGSGCGLSHQLSSPANVAIIRRAGMSLLRHNELKEVLKKAPPSAKEVWQDLVAVSNQAATQEARTLGLCRQNIHPSLCAGNCGRLHLCRLYAADMCPYGEKCWNGHNLMNSSHNSKLLKERGLENLTEDELLDAIEAGYLDRSPITSLECRFALQICHFYLDDDDPCEDDDCLRLHVCDGYVAGTCPNGSGCGLSHQLRDGTNAANIRRVGLNRLRHSELLEVLRVRPTAREVWQSIPADAII